MQRLAQVSRHLASKNSQLTRTFAVMAPTSEKQLQITTKYRMPDGYEIPALGYGVSNRPNGFLNSAEVLMLDRRADGNRDAVQVVIKACTDYMQVYQTPAAECEDVVLHAFKTGYRHVDSARAYRNEQPCADAIRNSGLPRAEIFFTSKVPPRAMGYDATKKAIEGSFAQTGLEYIDLYLIHCPYGGVEARKGTWRALLEAQQAGKIRSLGVSNYGVHHLDELEQYIKELNSQSPGSGGIITVGQWELHPWCNRSAIVDWCKQRGIVVQAYCPIVRNQRAEEPVLKELAAKYGKTTMQILIRWSLQNGFVPLPKSVNHGRIEENADVYDFVLEEADVVKLTTEKYEPCSWDPTTSELDN